MTASKKSIVLVGTVAAFFLAMGLMVLLDPATHGMMAIYSPPAFEADMRNEVRAVYGGFGVAIAALLVSTFYSDAIRLGARVAVAVALGGMALGRVISFMIEPADSIWPALTIGMELALAAMLLVARQD
ncbi:MAG: DUF4345 family protein [Alphaproteobacteria bacterium]